MLIVTISSCFDVASKQENSTSISLSTFIGRTLLLSEELVTNYVKLNATKYIKLENIGSRIDMQTHAGSSSTRPRH